MKRTYLSIVAPLFAAGIVLAAVVVLAHGCASIDTPIGGRTDYDPPVALYYSPANYSTNFNAQKIVVTFDERIKYKNLHKELVVSPPIKDIIQRIRPTAVLPSKKMEIDLSGIELLPNTTYTLNFGAAVGDNHEGAAIPNFKYVFSTGPEIDSLTVGGVVREALTGKFDPKTVVMLYRVDSTFTDSTIFKERPMYFTRLANEKDSTFLIENIAPGTYQLVALIDEGSDMMYHQNKDRIAFFPRHIHLEKTDSTGYLLRLAQARRPYKAYQGINKQKGLIQIAIDGLEPQDGVRRIYPPLPEGANDYYLFNPDRDTLQYWFTGGEQDSILFVVEHNGRVADTINAKIRKPAQEDFSVRIATRQLDLDGHIDIVTNKPVAEINPKAILLLDKDSTARPFSLKLDSASLCRIEMTFPVAAENDYRLSILPDAIRSILGETAQDTASIRLKTRSRDDYGNLTVDPVSLSQNRPLIVQLLSGENVVKETTLTQPEEKAVFRLVPPGQYRLRAIHDINGNGRWDTVDYLKKQQPERVFYLDDRISIRAMWDEERVW